MDKRLTILLACLISAHFCAGRIRQFKFSQLHKINVGSNSESKIISDYTVIWTPLNNSNFYLVSIPSHNISVHVGNSTVINLNSCSAFKEIHEQMTTPFYANFGDVGILQDIRVPKADEIMSKNFKLWINLLTQLNMTKILSENRSQYSYENIQGSASGFCKVKYDVLRKNISQVLHYFINETFDENSCSDTTTNSLIDVCNPDSEKNLSDNTKEEFDVFYYDPDLYYNNGSEKHTISYNPWKNNSAKIFIDMSVDFSLESLKNDTPSNISIPDNYEKMTVPVYAEVDTSLIDISSSSALKKTYSALACYAFNANYLLELYRYAIKC